jgi:hypothetical protein
MKAADITARRRLLQALFACGLLCTGGPFRLRNSVAQATKAPESPIPWESLTPEDQRVLAPGRERWQRWRDLPPERKARLRERLERFRRLPPQQQARVRVAFRDFRALPEPERRRLREEWRRLSPAERRARPRGRFVE